LKSLILLWNKVAEESATRCHTSATMDIKTVQGRCKHEGLSFLTITLPSFGKDFQKSLDQGIVARNLFHGFSWQAGLPRFLGGFLERVFDRNSGVLFDLPDIDAILAIRQLTLIYSKILLPCSDAREKEAMSGYVECDRQVKELDTSLSPDDMSEFKRMSFLLFRDLFTKLDKSVYDGDLIPKHGPGSTADKLRGNAKYRNRVWTDRLEKYFPSGDFLFSSPSYFNDEYDDITYLEPGQEIPVKVISVPKTQKTPRIIAVEPTAMQFAQQSILERIIDFHPDSLSGGFIGFEDQTINQRLALKGSSDGTLATLDLSDASDRVSNQLVREMLSPFPHLHGAVDACRSRRARVPGHGIQRLAKYASMGSALCFPIEAMVFLTTIFLGIEKELNTRFTKPSDFTEFLDRVHVYGDDIIIPTDMVFSVIESLEHFGAKVNIAKSFYTGRFRESCGKEYYDGLDVSVVKVRRLIPHSRKCVPEVISYISLRNQLYTAGYWKVVREVDAHILKMLKHFPFVEPSSSVLGRTSFLGYDTEKMCEKLHAPMVKGYVISSRLPRDPLEGQGALLKFFLKRGSLPTADRKHLERAGRPRAVDIKPRWASPF
jgi:hypothetical protein